MIPADKSRFLTWMLARDAESRIRNEFGAVLVRGLPQLRASIASAPVLVVLNHTSWWDPLVLQYLSARVLHVDGYALMDAKNLERFPFFRKVGAFGVNLESALDGGRAIRYAAKTLRTPGRVVWLFPQGKEVAITVRPLGFRPGSGEIARLAPHAIVVPGAVRYEFGNEPRPTLWLSFGAPIVGARTAEENRKVHEAAVGEELECIDHAIVRGERRSFESLHQQRPNRWSSLAEAILIRMTRVRALR